MIIVERKDSETIERMVKRYKRKHRDIKVTRQLRNRKHFTKPSEERRNQILSAAYRLKKFGEQS